MKKETYFIQLDGLRFFAVLMVMIAHWLQWQWGNPIVKAIPFGHGVILFFVLSGFLITRILLTYKDRYTELNLNKSQLILQFYKRRFLRIFPLYYALILFLFILNFENTRLISPWLFTYTSNIYQSIHQSYIGSFNHFWSLAVEEQFYLFWPILLLFIRKKATFYLIITTIVAAIIYRAILFSNDAHWMSISYSTLSSMHSLGIGALLAYISIYHKAVLAKLSHSKWLIAIISFYLIQLIIHRYFQIQWMKEILDEFFFSILSFFIILKAFFNGYKYGVKIILENRFIRYGGQISYGLYVFHVFIPKLYEYVSLKIGLSISNKYAEFILFFFVTVLLSHLSWKYFEKPINQLKSRIPYIKN